MLLIGLFTIMLVLATNPVEAQTVAGQAREFSAADFQRGSITPERAWWDVKHYHLSVEVFPETKRLVGSNKITFETTAVGQRMQIDLQQPLTITRVMHGLNELPFKRADKPGNYYLVDFPQPFNAGVETQIEVFYEGQPVESENPPWSGGITWTKDTRGHPFIASACQGIGASIWWPCKDHGADEPERGVDISLTVPDSLTGVANGRLTRTEANEAKGTRTFHWQVTYPINNYCVNINVGRYVSFSEKYKGKFGTLDMQYWVLDHQRDRAMQHFKEAPRVMAAFEYWFGKYPFYRDSYKLVAAPYLGMEHQSSVTYGNGFQNGYRGRDLSETGVGLLFDFIIVHESGHEWFGNNVSMKDAADMWIHESFTNYSESLFVEYHFSKQQAEDYVVGVRKLIKNDRPIIGTYGVNHEGSGDMYYKGSNMLHSLRQMVNDRERWRQILVGLNDKFRYQTVTSKQVEDYISEQTGIDLAAFFNQYLRTTRVPRFVFQVRGNQLIYHYENVVAGFDYPLVIQVDGKSYRIFPKEKAQVVRFPSLIGSCQVDRNFYVEAVRR